MNSIDPTSQQLAALSPEGRALLELLLQKEGVDVSSLVLPAAGETDTFPLSFAQEQLWILDQLKPGGLAYIVPAALRLEGALNEAALAHSLQQLLQRHPALRTGFPMTDSGPIQVVTPYAELALSIQDLGGLPESVREARAQELAAAEGQKPFDLASGPLFRATLLRLGPRSHHLLLTTHHIVADALSMAVLVQDLAALYEAVGSDKPAALPPVSIQYGDYALWQRRRVQGKVLETALAYWKEQLSGRLPILHLPTDRPRPAVQSFRGARHHFDLSQALTEELRLLSRQSGVTLFMTLLAAYSALLFRWTGEEDILIGSPVANRNRPGLERLIGLLVNILVMRADLSGDPSFRELLERIQKMALDAYAHQDVPFERLVEELSPERDLSHNPLCQVFFTFVNAPLPPLKLPGLTAMPVEIHNGTSKFDLLFELWDRPDGLTGAFEYNTDLFDSTTITRMAACFHTLLHNIGAHPEQPISALSFVSEEERRQLLSEWNDTRRDYPQDVCLNELFELQVTRTPSDVALRFEDEQVSYSELNIRANQLAHHLRALGVKPGVVTGICMRRSIDMVVGLLGILKAGGIYLPLNPAYPSERLAFMLQDARVTVLLTQADLGPLIHDVTAVMEDGSLQSATVDSSIKVVRVDADRDIIACQSRENPHGGALPVDPVYLIYTSGSTGVPKGVLGLHRGAVNRFHWMWETYPFRVDEICCQKTSLSFVDSVWEIFGPLLQGIPTVIIPDDVVQDSARLVGLLATENVTRIVLVPSLLSVILDAFEDLQNRLPKLRLWVVSGEALTVELSKRFYERMSRSTLLNLYGSSEVSADVTWYQVNPHESLSSVPIGRPIANTQVYLLDRHLQPVPVGVPGELHVGGVGLARGYLNRTDLTADKFIPNPLAEEPGDRLYKSGDQARYRPDGSIEFLGRLDHQVDIRGFRVELGEIEAMLRQHPALSETVVMAREDVVGDKRLVAYAVSQQQPAPTIHELRRFLRAKLPEYMVPAAFLLLDALPLLSSGKVNRLALPAPPRPSRDSGEIFIAPRTPVEEALARVWADVLGLDRMGVQENFFELGGHSLQAMQLASKMSAAMGRAIPVRLLFLHPTIADLAEALGDPSTFDQDPKPDSAVAGSGLSSVPSGDGSRLNAPSPFLRIERRPLSPLFASGEIASVDAAALLSLPSSLIEQSGMGRDQVIQGWFENLPVLNGVLETPLGRIGSIVLPRFSGDLYNDERGLVKLIEQALEMAGRLGAQTVSLTGLIASATDYGRAVAGAVAYRKELPKLTTGHASTTAAVVLAIQRILREAGRDVTQERVGFLGLGSVGMAGLRLMLKCLPHPAEIILCDVYSKLSLLEAIREEIGIDLGFRGPVRVTESQAEVPSGFYDATLIVGATNVPDILDIQRVNPGSMIVDDSSPHCFVAGRAVERFRAHQDILFTEGGVLQSPQPITTLAYLPWAVEQVLNPAQVEAFSNYNPFTITGCVLSGLLSCRFEDLKPTLGLVDGQRCFKDYQALGQLGFQAADLHCEGYVLAEDLIQSFRRHFSWEAE